MRVLIAIPVLIAGLIASEPAHADPYRWCATYGGGRHGGGTNCYFLTIQQCQAAVSGNGGFCNPNPFYDGRPVTTPEDGKRPRLDRHAQEYEAGFKRCQTYTPPRRPKLQSPDATSWRHGPWRQCLSRPNGRALLMPSAAGRTRSSALA